MKNKKLYFDMDGVLAVFNKHIPYEEIRQTKGYFKNLTPISCMVDFANMLLESGYDVNILSKAENDDITEEKRQWARRYLPFLPVEKLIIVDLHKDKTEYVSVDSDTVLFDDYSPNLVDWERCGGVAVNVVTSINHSDRAYVNVEPLPNQYYNSDSFPWEAKQFLLETMLSELERDLQKDDAHRKDMQEKQLEQKHTSLMEGIEDITSNETTQNAPELNDFDER